MDAQKKQLEELEFSLKSTQDTLKINEEKYMKENDESLEQIQKLSIQVEETNKILESYGKIMNKLRELKQNYIKITSVSSPVKSELFQQLTDDFEASTRLIDVILLICN